VQLAGQDITGVAVEEIVRKGLAHVPEGRGVIAELTVEENLRLGGLWRRRGAAPLEEIYELFPRLVERRGQPASRLSGGERQMLTIGRALMARPRVLLLDEPSLGLSPMLAKTILKIVRRFADQGVAILVVEQNARQALSVADRAYVLETGRIVLEGKAKDLAADERVQRAYLGGFETIAKEEGSEAAS
jgi:branched-chain amino acid transport system ATP-binding protein